MRGAAERDDAPGGRGEFLFPTGYKTQSSRELANWLEFDLPAYAGRLFDRNLSRPHALRLAIWRSLERGEAVPDAVAAANHDKIALIAAGQKDGRISDRFPAAELMVLITGLSILGVPYLAMANDQGQRRRSVLEAVRLLTEREGEQR